MSKQKIAAGPRVLSLKQPWAWAVSTGRKKIENRSWSTPYRGPVYIHAGKQLNRAALDWLRREVRIKPPATFVRGAVIAVAEITDVVTRGRAARFGRWFSGPYGLVLSNARALKRPVPVKGALGLRAAPMDLQRRVNRALRTSS